MRTHYLIVTLAMILTGLFIWIGVNSPKVKPARVDTLVVIQTPVYVDSGWRNHEIILGTNTFPPPTLFAPGKTRDTVFETKVIWK